MSDTELYSGNIETTTLSGSPEPRSYSTSQRTTTTQSGPPEPRSYSTSKRDKLTFEGEPDPETFWSAVLEEDIVKEPRVFWTNSRGEYISLESRNSGSIFSDVTGQRAREPERYTTSVQTILTEDAVKAPQTFWGTILDRTTNSAPKDPKTFWSVTLTEETELAISTTPETIDAGTVWVPTGLGVQPATFDGESVNVETGLAVKPETRDGATFFIPTGLAVEPETFDAGTVTLQTGLAVQPDMMEGGELEFETGLAVEPELIEGSRIWFESGGLTLELKTEFSLETTTMPDTEFQDLAELIMNSLETGESEDGINQGALLEDGDVINTDDIGGDVGNRRVQARFISFESDTDENDTLDSVEIQTDNGTLWAGEFTEQEGGRRFVILVEFVST